MGLPWKHLAWLFLPHYALLVLVMIMNARAKYSSLCNDYSLLHAYLPTVPEFPGLHVPETDLLSCCPGNNQNCPGNCTCSLGVYYVQASLSDKLLPADECQYQWVRTVRTGVQEGHASGIPIGSAIMCPQAEREPLSSIVNSLQTTLGMLLCSESKLSCTRQQNPAKY